MKTTIGKDSYRHILKYTGVFGGVQGIGMFLGLVRNKFIATLLGPDGMGLLSLFNATLRLLTDATGLGLPVSAVRELSQACEESREIQVRQRVAMIRCWFLLAALGGALLCLLLSPLLATALFRGACTPWQMAWLSPVMALTTVAAGEIAVLKGTRHLRALAAISLVQALFSLVATVPLFYYWGRAAIVPSLSVVAVGQLLLAIVFAYRHFPPRRLFSRRYLRTGCRMVGLGMAFVVAGVMTGAADFIIRFYLNARGGLHVVGLYNAGTMLTTTCAGVVLASLETDYFPRLSAAGNAADRLNGLINRQTEVLQWLMSPLLVGLLVGLPLLLPLLYSGRFLPALGMVQLAALAMYVRALMLPVAYLPLARGQATAYLLIEGCSALVLVGCVALGYEMAALRGVGAGMLLAGVLDYAVNVVFARRRYGYRVHGAVLLAVGVQLPLCLAAYAATQLLQGAAYWCAGALLLLCTAGLSLHQLKSRTNAGA